MKRIAFTGGGTGGHIYPNLAIIEDLNENYPQSKLFYFGNPKKLEAKLLSSDDITDFKGTAFKNYVEFVAVNSEPLIKSINPFKVLSWINRFNQYKKEAVKALQEKKIDLVFGTGGFAAGPVFAAAEELKIPYIIHNLDAHMGLANKVFVKGAAALTLGVCELGIKPKSNKVFITGNPISQKFLESLKEEKAPSEKLHLLITGGSQGAQSINKAIGELLNEFKELNIEIIHITGEKNYQEHKDIYLKPYPGKYEFYKVLDYSHEMPRLCAWADIAICRSGAMTVAEMLASQTLSIFIPLPWAAHDHQTKNAKAISDSGAAITLDQDDPGLKDNLLKIIKSAAETKQYLLDYKEKINSLNLKDSNKEIIKVIQEILN